MIRGDQLRETVRNVAAETKVRTEILQNRLRQCAALAIVEPDVVRPQSLSWHARADRGNRGALLKVVRVGAEAYSYGTEVALYLDGKRTEGGTIYRSSESGFRSALLHVLRYLRTGAAGREVEATEATPDLTPPATLPNPERVTTREQPAFSRGRPIGNVTIELVDKVWMTSQMKAKWLAMKSAAGRDGILLVPTFGFRTMQQQREIYVARMDQEGDSPETLKFKKDLRAVKGIAAKPGYSLHQSGRALDISVGLSAAEYKNGDRTPTFLWLEQNAARFGFAVMRVPNEPWHLEMEG